MKGERFEDFISKSAVKSINAMDKTSKQRIRQAIEGIPEGDIKPLKGSHILFRLRVGTRRIVFSYIDTETVLIERIGNRGDIYKGGLL